MTHQELIELRDKKFVELKASGMDYDDARMQSMEYAAKLGTNVEYPEQSTNTEKDNDWWDWFNETDGVPTQY